MEAPAGAVKDEDEDDLRFFGGRKEKDILEQSDL